MGPLFSSAKKINQVASNDLASGLNKKNILIVGGTAGIGKALAISCLKRNANVTIVGRRAPDDTLSKATFFKKDLSLMVNAHSLADDIDLKKIDIVVFTNGIIAAPTRQESEEKLELDLAVSYLSRLVFAKTFLSHQLGSQRFDKNHKARIFIMGYPGEKTAASVDDFNSEKQYSTWVAHMNTVVGNEAMVTYLDQQLPDVNVYGLNPGLIRTEIRDNYLQKGSWTSGFVEGSIGLFCKNADSYAENVLIHLLVSDELENSSKALIDSSSVLLTPNEFLVKDNGVNQARVIKESEILIDRVLKK